jgi:hypothetical protein
MPLSRNDRSATTHLIFFPLLTLIFILWVLYRSLFEFPVWFDETVGKAIFFGFPVWLYITVSRSRSIIDTFAGYKLQSGLLLGLAVGGMLGFAASLISLLQRGAPIEAVWLFESSEFWREFLLAMMTAFWETLLFFSFVMVVIQEKFKHWALNEQAFLTAIIFLLFHLPNTYLRFGDSNAIIAQAMLLFLFALGQAYLFAARRNAYALVISHTVWGMVLLVHAW